MNSNESLTTTPPSPPAPPDVDSAGCIDIMTIYLRPNAELQPTDPLFIEAHELRKCKITTYQTHARLGSYAGAPSWFLGFRFLFLPAPGTNTRFKHVRVTISFLPPPPGARRLHRATPHPRTTTTTPVILAHEPKLWEGPLATRRTTTSIAGHVDLNPASGVITLGSIGGEISKEDSVIVEGRARIVSNNMSRSSIGWNLSENEVSARGVPNPFQVAMIVKAENDTPRVGGATTSLEMLIQFEVRLSKSANPLSWIASRVKKNQTLILKEESPVGPIVEGINNMEADSFELANFINTR